MKARFYYLWLFVFITFACGKGEMNEKIGIFDLSYTLQTDLSTKAGLNTAWDDVHTVATLQGIVKRNDPKLYVFLAEKRSEFEREGPFLWMRNIAKTPTWHVQVMEEVTKQDPNIVLLDAPSFFELLRLYIQEKENHINNKYNK